MTETYSYTATIEHATKIKLYVKTLNQQLKSAAKASRKYSEAINKLAEAMTPPLDPSFINIATVVKRSLTKSAQMQTQFTILCSAASEQLAEHHAYLKKAKALLKAERDKMNTELAKAQRSFQMCETFPRDAAATDSSDTMWSIARETFRETIEKATLNELKRIEAYNQGVEKIAESLTRQVQGFASFMNFSAAAPAPAHKTAKSFHDTQDSILNRVSTRVSQRMSRRLD
eukprot:CAMPEP_0204907432 /NCGR_PEP_ID=MMETSP1397-20131031/6581_1 /ASSEMBLY_ACC=CAM_ASM_000891 /TAXON_ID=49980 /ORGANISM="Climacostomum Climacostomum virens, Strain Stock W-24" /LENGTH=229 /DNA_ID=CAMNT_0052076579 /DNA_START=201 /DNA_END=887 /DNA_ORIENTATION=+